VIEYQQVNILLILLPWEVTRSHTKELNEEALDELEKYLEEKHLTEDIEVAKYGASVKRT